MGSVHAAVSRVFGCPAVMPGLPRPGRTPGERLGDSQRVRALYSGEFACRVVGGGAALT
jgi:hypothetical protein